MLNGPLKAGTSGPEASPGPAAATAWRRLRPLRGRALRALLSSSSRTLRDYDDTHIFSHPLHKVALRGLGGAGRGSGELGGAHAGIPPGDPSLGIRDGSRRRGGERREERREERKGRMERGTVKGNGEAMTICVKTR